MVHSFSCFLSFFFPFFFSQDRIRDLVEGGGQSKADEERIATLESSMEGLQEQAVRDKMAILKLREDNRAVFNKLQEFRKK